MRIVDVCAFYTPHGGGVKTYVEQKMRIGPELGHDITILAPGDRHAVIERGPHARIITIPGPRFLLDRKYWYFGDEEALHAKLDELAPDFVECSSPWRSASMVARWAGPAPRALVMHADPLSAYAYRWFEPVMSRETIDRRLEPFWRHLRELSGGFERVVCASAELRDRLAAGGLMNTVLHPMGIEADLFSPARRSAALRRRLLALCGLPENARLLIGVGRLSPEKRWPMVVDAVAAEIGAGRTGIRLSPVSPANDSAESNPQAVFGPLVEALNQRGIAFIHFVEGSTGGPRDLTGFDFAWARQTFKGAYIANNGYTRDMAIDAIASGRADAVAFGRAYISNPDLVQRLKANAPLAKAHSSTFYVPGPEGYIDYPAM